MQPLSSTHPDGWLERVDSLADGADFPSAERARLAEWVEADDQRVLELARLQKLQRLMVEARVPVRSDLVDTVMSRLELSRRPRVASWAAAAMAVLGLGVAAFVLLSRGGQHFGGWMVGPSGAVLDFMASATLAGAGLLGASWKGVGEVMGGWLLESTPNLVLGVGFVVAANLLLVVLLRHSYVKRAAVRAESREDRELR